MAPFLDALAAVAVSKERGEVIAIALRLTKSNLELIISGNTTILPETIEYLHALWGLLGALADVCSKRHTSPMKSGDRDTSPPMRRELPQEDPPYNSLHRHIFKFCIAKFRRQFTKYWSKIDAFGRNHGAWRRAQSDFVDETQENFESFRDMCRSLELCSDLLSELEENPDDEGLLDTLIQAMSMAYEFAKVVLDSPTNCETWVSRISTDNPQRKFWPSFCCPISLILFTFRLIVAGQPRLRRFIEKITTFYRHIVALNLSAYPPRLSPIYKLEFSITSVPVPAARIPAVIPTGTQQWLEIRDAMYRLKGYESTSPACLIPRNFHGRTPVIHCEISLILYLDSTSDKPTFNYIGVSKLSCKACHLWIAAHRNCTKGMMRYTRGSHDKWYPWYMPQCSEEINRYFVGLVASEYCKEGERKGKARRLSSKSDSTAASDVPGSQESIREHAKQFLASKKPISNADRY